MSASPRPTVRLTLRCDNRCVFCGQAGVRDEAREPRDALRGLRDEGYEEVTLVGGEPGLVDGLPEVVAAARQMGFTRVGLQTNGSRLADRASKLARAGLTDVHLSIQGARPEIHDYITGVEGSHARALAACAAARRQGLVVVATTVLTRSGFRSLGDLPALLASRGVAAWCVAVPRVAGRTCDAFDRVVPRLALALPYALHAISTAQRLRLPAFLDGAPLCLLGPHATRALSREPLAFVPACDGCGLRSRCPGLDPSYAVRFDGDEVVSRPGPPPAEPGPAELARMFVGPGELALPAQPADPIHLGPRHKGTLPVVG